MTTGVSVTVYPSFVWDYTVVGLPGSRNLEVVLLSQYRRVLSLFPYSFPYRSLPDSVPSSSLPFPTPLQSLSLPVPFPLPFPVPLPPCNFQSLFIPPFPFQRPSLSLPKCVPRGHGPKGMSISLHIQKKNPKLYQGAKKVSTPTAFQELTPGCGHPSPNQSSFNLPHGQNTSKAMAWLDVRSTLLPSGINYFGISK